MKDFSSGSYMAFLAIHTYHTSTYERLAPDIAALDKELFLKIHSTYEKINQLVGYRNILIDYLADQNLSIDPIFNRSFLSGLADQKDFYYEDLKKTYKLITNKEL